jgi:type II secretory pathway component GspD/PulD (secretin)
MRRQLMMWAVLLMAAGVSGTVARAQQPTGPPQPASVSKPAMVSLEVEVVLARYQGDKKISSIPYTLNVTANGDQTTLNMGTEVPVAMSTFVPANQTGNQPAPLRSYNYRPIGTNFILRATTVTDNLYQIQLNVEDSSVFTPDARQQAMPMAPDVPAFRSFKGTNSLLLKDGQTRQYTVATDRVTGEVLKVDVSLKVLKN